ncbi:DUF2806 domain-containing protein [Pelagicoccus sp. SDUM812003]|uniref:DUF2806 domain-containing protein n=1 Tax=Pelagicoccus sp. SDUM812003 TaxID=3041267 RepID=UPI00280C429E|nr:DUF2806 domain-containing protein [Pelagicoccus sp. SDUM812003]MDQ8202795.1 DUF2806 domain-containing protein [Pelagicoccus sp. SDUM812003]
MDDNRTRSINSFLDTISADLGSLYKPKAISEKLVNVESLDKTVSEIQSSETLSRAQKRLAMQEARRQVNIDSVVEKSLEEISEEIPSKQMDPDWIARFFQEAKDTSDEDVQSIWAKVLAGEYENPGSFSKRALSMVKDLSKEEAEEIQTAASRVWEVELSDGSKVKYLNVLIVDKWSLGTGYDESTPFVADYKGVCQLLQDCGFLHSDDFQFHFSGEGYLDPEKYRLGDSSAKALTFYDKRLVARTNQPGFLKDEGPTVTEDGRPKSNTWQRQIFFDAWRLTREGEALLRVIKAKPDLALFQKISEVLEERGFSYDTVILNESDPEEGYERSGHNASA